MANINARTQFYLDNPNFIQHIGQRFNIPEEDIEDFSQTVLLDSLQNHCDEHVKFNERYAREYVIMHVKMYQREKRDEKPLRDNEVPITKATPESLVEQKESWLYTQEVIRKNGYTITNRQSEVMEMLFDGKTVKQTAEYLNISDSRIYKIKGQIKRKVEKIEKKRGKKSKNYPKNDEN